MDCPPPPTVATNVPEIVVTLKFKGVDKDPSVPPTYEITASNTNAACDAKGGIDFWLRENDDVKITFQIHPDYYDEWVRFAPYDDNALTFYALRSRDTLLGAAKVPQTAKNASDQFECDATCLSNSDRSKIVVNYANDAEKGPYTRYGFRYQVKVKGNWANPIVTPDPGIKNGGVNLYALLGILAALGASIVGIAFWVIQRLRRRNTRLASSDA